MVYWHDKEASTSASIALVNDIDIQLTTPGGFHIILGIRSNSKFYVT